MAWNSGFWDGVYDRLHHQPRRSREANIRPLPSWSPFYCAGYDAGTDAAIDGFNGSRSTEYWQPWRDALNERDEAAMLRKEQGWK